MPGSDRNHPADNRTGRPPGGDCLGRKELLELARNMHELHRLQETLLRHLESRLAHLVGQSS